MSVLKNWSLYQTGTGVVVFGEVCGDKRWEDGELIKTSAVKSIKFNGAAGELKTKNSTYCLEGMSDEVGWRFR